MATRVAVIFGGRSPEHDVSIMTGLQALEALDQRLYEGFPVYIGLDGAWWVGEALRRRESYLPSAATRAALTEVTLERRAGRPGGRLTAPAKGGLFQRRPFELAFDVALLALHGLNGEDGRLQGALELAGVPYTGMRLLASALLMDKAAAKRMLAGAGVPLLPFVTLDRPAHGLMPSADEVKQRLGGLAFPLIAKPTHLGSSIGVAKVGDVDELRACLPPIFGLDTQAIVEPCVTPLVEYNVSVAMRGGEVATSAIERPKSTHELLDFKEKYLSGGGAKKSGRAASSEGMLSLTRDIAPELPAGAEANIRRWARACYAAAGGAGAPRIDFVSNAATGEIWLNEVNPCPGSFAYYLWEAADPSVSFPELLDGLVQEALAQQRALELPADPTLKEARLFPHE